jgi:hypothetical protein
MNTSSVVCECSPAPLPGSTSIRLKLKGCWTVIAGRIAGSSNTLLPMML